ncbi:MAG: ribonuclease Z [Solirubrobacterales bacterium]|nr:ribonuclease Z [Solirubrobacterales bacterium]
MELSIFFAGTGGSSPTARRGLPATVVRVGGEWNLIDCGEGTQRQLISTIGLGEIERIFITHLHLDHWLGLPGMLKSFDLRGRERPLTVHGPPGARRTFEAALDSLVGRTGYHLSYEEIGPHEEVRGTGYSVEAFAVDHRGVAAQGYAIVEDVRPGAFHPERAAALGVSPGPDFGRLQRGETVDGVSPDQVVDPQRPGRRIVFSGDTRPCDGTLAAAYEADVLIHEATFLDVDRARAQETGHSTAREAGELASEARVGLLALTHCSTRYRVSELRDEAREVFGQTEIPRDFDTIEVPFPERGQPELRRWAPVQE